MKRGAFLRRFSTAVLGCGMLAEALLAATPEIEEEELVEVMEVWGVDPAEPRPAAWSGYEVLHIDYPNNIITYGRRERGALTGITE